MLQERHSGLSAGEVRQFGVIAAVGAVAVAVWLADLDPMLQFILSGVAVAGMAHVLGVATEQAGEAAGSRVSALLNATFGNAAEIIIVILAIQKGLIDIAKFSIIGSVLGNVLLILGASLLACGLRHGRRPFDRGTAGINATMLVLATVFLGMPTLYAATDGHTTLDENHLSVGVALLMVLLYAAYLYASFQTFEEDSAGHESAGGGRWSVRLALIMLAASAVATGVLSEVLVGAIEPTIEETGISEVFIGLIVVPLVGNIAEHLAAVRIAWTGDLDFSMGIAFNSALQVALAVSAVAVFGGLALGHDVSLVFTPLEMALLGAATVLAGLITAAGRANWLEGVQLLAIYVVAGLVFWYS